MTPAGTPPETLANPITRPWSLADVRDMGLEDAARSCYSERLQYHNFEHVQDTLRAAETIILRCIDEGLRVDPEIVYYALLFHDAGYYENHQSLGFESKEAYSAHLAENVLSGSGIRPRVVRKVIEAIMATHRYGRFVSVEQKVVRAADLSGLAAPYAVFYRNTCALKEEQAMLTGRELGWAQWLAQISETIRFYLSQEIRLTSYFVNDHGESAFHQAVRNNLERLIRESALEPHVPR